MLTSLRSISPTGICARYLQGKILASSLALHMHVPPLWTPIALTLPTCSIGTTRCLALSQPDNKSTDNTPTTQLTTGGSICTPLCDNPPPEARNTPTNTHTTDFSLKVHLNQTSCNYRCKTLYTFLETKFHLSKIWEDALIELDHPQFTGLPMGREGPPGLVNGQPVLQHPVIRLRQKRQTDGGGVRKSI